MYQAGPARLLRRAQPQLSNSSCLPPAFAPQRCHACTNACRALSGQLQMSRHTRRSSAPRPPSRSGQTCLSAPARPTHPRRRSNLPSQPPRLYRPSWCVRIGCVAAQPTTESAGQPVRTGRTARRASCTARRARRTGTGAERKRQRSEESSRQCGWRRARAVSRGVCGWAGAACPCTLASRGFRILRSDRRSLRDCPR